MSIARDALDQLLGIAGREPADFVRLDEGPPAMVTRFHAEEAAAAALAATGVIAADLWRDRTGESQTVAVCTREAGTGLISFLHQAFEDPTRAPPIRPDDGARGTPAMGFFPARDGRYVYLHPSFPASAAKLHALMGSPIDKETVAETALGWTAMDLETAIAEAGICGAMARTPQEWDASEQGRVLAARPVVEVTKIADGPPIPLPPSGTAPLSGVRVLDLTRVLAGPTCARTLAQYGADVLYVASPNLPFTAGFVSDTNHGKLSTHLDLTDPGDLARLKDLVATCDVFSQGYRTGGLERMGLGPLDLARLNPGIVYTSINAYGHEGPWRGRPGWEQLAQTVTGLAHLHGEHMAGGEKGPILQPGAVTDYTTGYLAALGSLIALQRRARYGGSYLVRVSLSQTAVWLRKLGIAGPERLAAIQPVTAEEADGWKIDSDSGWGRVRHLRPSVQMSKTPTAWTRPVVPLGTHPPVWPN
jgi:crotonobetainyl-CoA:carnitine CoA-transferase CaiB-like acyl-CoA transferase